MTSLFGIRNMGNTCYLNSIFHCLRHNPELSRYLSSPKFIKDLKKNKFTLIESFSNIIERTKNIEAKIMRKNSLPSLKGWLYRNSTPSSVTPAINAPMMADNPMYSATIA